MKSKFLIIFLATIIITRFILYFIPRSNYIYLDSFHHIYIGIILLVLYFIFKNNSIIAVALGLIVDEIALAPFYIADLINKPLAPKEFWAYWSLYSVVSVIILAFLVSFYLIKGEKNVPPKK